MNEAFCPSFAGKGLESIEVEIADETFTQCAETLGYWTLMAPEHREALKSSAEWLVHNLTVSDELMNKLSLCTRRRQAIDSAATREDKVKTLIDIVSRQPGSVSYTHLTLPTIYSV